MDKDQAINWAGECIYRLRDELDCAARHFEQGEFSKVVVHAHSFELGVKALSGVLFEFVLGMRDRAEVVKVYHETTTGQPMKIEEFKDGFMLYPEEVIVPEPEDFM